MVCPRYGKLLREYVSTVACISYLRPWLKAISRGCVGCGVCVGGGGLCLCVGVEGCVCVFSMKSSCLSLPGVCMLGCWSLYGVDAYIYGAFGCKMHDIVHFPDAAAPTMMIFLIFNA